MKTTESSKPPVFHTLQALAGALGVPVHIVRSAKKAGATGFAANGSVDGFKLLAWCLTKGKDFAPTVSLEEARARLTIKKAEALDREEAISGGELVPIGFAMRQHDEAFSLVGRHAAGRVETLLNMLQTVAGGDKPSRDRDIRSVIEEDTRDLLRMQRQGRDAFYTAMKDGPKGADSSPLAEAENLIRQLCDKISPAARSEIVAALVKK
jgi:hypothetical protein